METLPLFLKYLMQTGRKVTVLARGERTARGVVRILQSEKYADMREIRIEHAEMGP